jgi:hypothetical protein
MIRWLTSTNHSNDFSALVEIFDQRLGKGRLGYGLSAFQATRDNDGVIFSLERAARQAPSLNVDDGEIHTTLDALSWDSEISGTMQTPREHWATSWPAPSFPDLPDGVMSADVHSTPARTRVSYTMVLIGKSN